MVLLSTWVSSKNIKHGTMYKKLLSQLKRLSSAISSSLAFLILSQKLFKCKSIVKQYNITKKLRQ